MAYHQYYDFRFTESEATAWERGDETLADRKRPIEDRGGHYTVSVYAEPRLCRYRETMQWPETVSFPFNAGFVARERLPIRHYPHRDPVQLRRRCRLRAIMMADAENRRNWPRPEQHHWSKADWRKFVAPDDLPDLQYWEPGSELPLVHQTNHLAGAHVRALQRLGHGLALSILDRRRRPFSPSAHPQPISPEIIAQLAHDLARE